MYLHVFAYLLRCSISKTVCKHLRRGSPRVNQGKTHHVMILHAPPTQRRVTPDCGRCQMFPRGPEAVVKSPCADFSGVNVHFTVTVTMLYVFKVEAACLRPPLLMLASARESHNIKRPKLTCYMSAAWRGCILKLALDVLLSCCLNLSVSFLNGHQCRRGSAIIAK